MALTSCSDDASEPQDNSGNNSSSSESAQNYPTPSDADGVLVAVKSNSVTDTPIGPITTILGTGVAIFSDDGFSSGEFISAGGVTCNGNDLTLNPNNSYVFDDISAANPSGLDFTSQVLWSVSGGNGIPFFNHDAINLGFPTVGQVNSAETVVRADGYTLTCESVLGADSVIFLVGGVNKTIAGNATSCSFTSAELADVDAGSNVVQVAAYVGTSTTLDSKKMYFYNETVQTQSVTVQ